MSANVGMGAQSRHGNQARSVCLRRVSSPAMSIRRDCPVVLFIPEQSRPRVVNGICT